MKTKLQITEEDLLPEVRVHQAVQMFQFGTCEYLMVVTSDNTFDEAATSLELQ